MKIDEFKLERTLARFQNEVEYDLSASGIYPMFIREILTPQEMEDVYSNLHLKYVHTAGTKHLREAVASFYEGMDPSSVFMTNGSAEALYIMAWGLIEPGDEVAFMIPNFMLLSHVVESNGGVVRNFNLDPGNGWALDVESLKKAVTPKTKLICVCNPNNPTGTVLSKKQMQEVVDVAASVGAYVLSDEVYRGAEQGDAETPSFWGMYDKVIVISGLSKSFGLPGLRIGWVAGPREIAEMSWFYHDFLSTTVTTFSDFLATKALEPEMRKKIFARNRGIVRQNLATFTEWVNSHKDVLSFTSPQAGCFAFVKYDLSVSSWDLVMDMVKNNSVFVIPGSCFGIENHLRMNFGVDKPRLEEGLIRVGRTLSRFK
ncbi:MAG: aminotransferase class I/II-fold pyridoxal phosphate-dependent enzyme [Thermovirgaceae bacterium]|nr:aminotransferase class I/II-fold pyridoxal phosphate-dependent enzyme [Thermovirgaceae bacterium]